MPFSDRLGITKPRAALQIESIDEPLRNGLWQACIEHLIKPTDRTYDYDSIFIEIMSLIYVDFFKKTTDSVPYGHAAGIQSVRSWFFSAEWWEVYNFIEFLLPIGGSIFSERVSEFLEREKSGYRIIDEHLVPITDRIEINSITDAISTGNRFASALEHLKTAVDLFAKKPRPDYRNSIKEAISAVESAAKIISGN